MAQAYKILDSKWWSQNRAHIGIVAIETFPDQWKAYIGTGMGYNQEDDTQMVVAHGSGLLAEEACGFFPHLSIDHYKRDE